MFIKIRTRTAQLFQVYLMQADRQLNFIYKLIRLKLRICKLSARRERNERSEFRFKWKGLGRRIKVREMYFNYALIMKRRLIAIKGKLVGKRKMNKILI